MEPRDRLTSRSATETISISIKLGITQTSSIKLPRNHALVESLMRLMSSTATQLKPFDCAQVSTPKAFSIPTFATLPYQPKDRYQTSETAYLPQSSRYYSDTSTTNESRVYPYTQQHANNSSGTFKRCRSRANLPNYSKRCRVMDCAKMSVSRGLCRGHGGGRRCQHFNCTKGAQSRSDFCWAHGGGHRCEIKGCTRSRKSKSYCVAHLNLENTVQTKDKDFSSYFERSWPAVVSSTLR